MESTMNYLSISIIATFLFSLATSTNNDCGNGICDKGENCLSCAVDCISGTSGGSKCGNGVCEDGETCFTCPDDCMSSETLSVVLMNQAKYFVVSAGKKAL